MTGHTGNYLQNTNIENLYKATCSLSRQVVFNDRENKHSWVKTERGKWKHLSLFGKTFALSSDRPHSTTLCGHDDVIKWKHFPRYWSFVWGIHRSPVNSTHKGQWRRVLMFYLICAWTNGWVNTRDVGDLRRHRDNYDATVMGRGK